MTPAEQEAYANCRADRVHLVTLELSHPAFTDTLFVVRDNHDLSATLDGQPVVFRACWFDITRPPISEDPDPSLTIQIDNVSGLLTPYLMAASKAPDLTDLIFRPYEWREEDSTAECLSELRLKVRNANADMSSASITAALVNPANILWPRETYTPERFRAL